MAKAQLPSTTDTNRPQAACYALSLGSHHHRRRTHRHRRHRPADRRKCNMCLINCLNHR